MAPIKVDVSGQAVNARGVLVNIPTQTIALPEPAGPGALGAGLLALSALYRLRMRRRR